MSRRDRSAVTLLMVAGLLFPGAARAEAVISVETKGGFGAAQFTGDGTDSRAKHGFSGAIAYHRSLGEVFSVQAEAGYAMKGTSFGTVTDPVFGSTTYVGTFEYLYAADYFEFPLLLRAQVPGGRVRPGIFAGPVLGWKVLEKARLHSQADGDYEGKGNSLKAIDFAYAGGIGFEFGPPGHCLTLDARYTASLNDNLRDEYSGTIRNADFRVTLGWKTLWKPGFGTL